MLAELGRESEYIQTLHALISCLHLDMLHSLAHRVLVRTMRNNECIAGNKDQEPWCCPASADQHCK